MYLKNNLLNHILACPNCKDNLIYNQDESNYCSKCKTHYRIVDGIPFFVETPKVFKAQEKKCFMQNVYNTIPTATTWTDESVFNFVNQLSDESIILNLGSGSGNFDEKIKKRMINLDVVFNDYTDIVADGHCLPFRDGVIDCVFSNAALEHVNKPWVVAEEIERVLKPGGYIAINLPFLNVIHDEEDYFRFTLKGIKQLFPQCKEIAGGVSSGGASFLPICLNEYIKLYIPTNLLKFIFSFIWGHVFYRLKRVDKLVCKNNKYCITANSFYYIGIKT